MTTRVNKSGRVLLATVMVGCGAQGDPADATETAVAGMTTAVTDSLTTVGSVSGSSNDATDSAAGTSPVGTSAGSDPMPSTTTGTGDSAGDAGPMGELSELSDEFDEPDALAQWRLRDVVEGTPAQYTTLDVDETTAGHLTIVPTASGWFADFDGPFMFKLVEGDFIVETHAAATSLSNPPGPPMEFFNSAGLLVRDPDHGENQEDWVAHNTGYQNQQVGTEGKSTVGSHSELTIQPGIHHGRLRICRIGDEVILTRELDDEDGFRETHRFSRPDLPSEVQVGLMSNGWNSLGVAPDTAREPDVMATFDYVRFWRPAGEADCLAD